MLRNALGAWALSDLPWQRDSTISNDLYSTAADCLLFIEHRLTPIVLYDWMKSDFHNRLYFYQVPTDRRTCSEQHTWAKYVPTADKTYM